MVRILRYITGKRKPRRYLKTNCHFKFNPCRRFIFTRSKENILIRGGTFYRNDLGQPKGICKRGIKIKKMEPKELHIESTT